MQHSYTFERSLCTNNTSVPSPAYTLGILKLTTKKLSTTNDELCVAHIPTPTFSPALALGGVPYLTPDLVLTMLPVASSILHFSLFDDPRYQPSAEGLSLDKATTTSQKATPKQNEDASSVTAPMSSLVRHAPTRTFPQRCGLSEYGYFILPRSVLTRSSTMSTVKANIRRWVEDTTWGRKEIHVKDFTRISQEHGSFVPLTPFPASEPNSQVFVASSGGFVEDAQRGATASIAGVNRPLTVKTHGGLTIHEIFNEVRSGVDILCTDLLVQLAKDGVALNVPTVPLPYVRQVAASVSADEEDPAVAVQYRVTYMNLMDPVHELVAAPLLEECTCPSCISHTRAYLHHLLNLKELNAHTLLHAHNLASFQRLFCGIRENIQHNYLEVYERILLRLPCGGDRPAPSSCTA